MSGITTGRTRFKTSVMLAGVAANVVLLVGATTSIILTVSQLAA